MQEQELRQGFEETVEQLAARWSIFLLPGPFSFVGVIHGFTGMASLCLVGRQNGLTFPEPRFDLPAYGVIQLTIPNQLGLRSRSIFLLGGESCMKLGPTMLPGMLGIMVPNSGGHCV